MTGRSCHLPDFVRTSWAWRILSNGTVKEPQYTENEPGIARLYCPTTVSLFLDNVLQSLLFTIMDTHLTLMLVLSVLLTVSKMYIYICRHNNINMKLHYLIMLLL